MAGISRRDTKMLLRPVEAAQNPRSKALSQKFSQSFSPKFFNELEKNGKFTRRENSNYETSSIRFSTVHSNHPESVCDASQN
jgi:hypothetical protein